MSKKLRLVHVNCNIPGASFYTVQEDDYSVLPYDLQKQPAYEALIRQYKIEFTEGRTGDAYSEWIMPNSEQNDKGSVATEAK
jgi:hypothetical protein